MSDEKNNNIDDDTNEDDSKMDTSKILRDVKNTKDIQKTVSSDNNNENVSNNTTVSESLGKTNDILLDINSIRTEICKLTLNPCQREYLNNSVLPLLTVLDFLSRSANNLASSVNYLSGSCITFRKESNLKDTLHTVYEINKQCDDVYKELKRRVDKLLCYKD